MADENQQNGNQEQNKSSDLNQENQAQNGFYENDFIIPIEGDEDSLIIMDDEIKDQNREENQNQQQEENNKDVKIEDDNRDIKFEENQEHENSFDEDAAIEKLKAQGYDIKKQSQESEEQKNNTELDRLQGIVDNSSEFLKQSDEQIIITNVKNEIAKRYEDSGRNHLIGTEEFSLEVEAETEEITSNTAMKKIYAENVRRKVQDWSNQNKSKYDELNNSIEKENSNKLLERRNNLQKSLNEIKKEGFMNTNPSDQELQGAYKSITDGSFSKKINNNPKLVAQFALFLDMQEKIATQQGKGTYGEGVKAAIDELAGSSNNKSRGASLQQGISSRNSGASEVENLIDGRFGNNDVVVKKVESDKIPYIAGSGMY